MACSLTNVGLTKVIHCSRSIPSQMTYRLSFILQEPSSLCFLHVSSKNPKSKSAILPSSSKSSSSVFGFQALQGSCFDSSVSKQLKTCDSLTVRRTHYRYSKRRSLDILLGSEKLNLHFCAPWQTRNQWSQYLASAGLFIGLVSCSSSEPVYADAPDGKQDKDCEDNSSILYSLGKKVWTDYSVTSIPGDGRCLFRSVVHGACVREGKPAPDEKLQRELADDLRTRVVDELVKRREGTEWFIEGDFDTYVSRMRKPHVWGGEPEILMACHVLKVPITVYMHDQDAGGLISIAEYGQEYGRDNPIRVLYHGFGHYESLQIPGKAGSRSRL